MANWDARGLVLALGMCACVGCGGKVVLAQATGGSAGASGASGAGGAAGSPASGGSAGVDSVASDGPQQMSKQLDLLLVVDNSSSMADKQQVLAQSARDIIGSLVNPPCVDASGTPVMQPAGPGDACLVGKRELAPVRDMHIGVITSSLGGRGSQICSQNSPPIDDMGQLLPSVRAGVPSWNNSGFLAWDPDQRDSPPGETSANTLIAALQATIISADQRGCGFESPLEAMYRFLADPKPPTHLGLVNGVTGPIGGTDQTVLTERHAFLRPDSAVMVVVLTDEDDCSMIDHGQAYLVGDTSSHLPRATSACNTDPNSKCCFSCGVTGGIPSGCTPPSQDANCQKGTYSVTEDAINLRCFHQQQRFGISFLFPPSRYHNALRLTRICPSEADLACAPGDTSVKNPLFAGGRSPTLVSFAVITGVPWQDIARHPADAQTLSYMSAAELDANGRWPVILGDVDHFVPPSDPFMRESIAQRSGKNPITGAPIEPPTTTTPNAINGHEDDVTDGSDLQYACIFKLPQSRDCARDPNDCDCYTGNPIENSPLCELNEVAPPGTTQYYAKAYPGLRQLQVARDLGYKAVVASICPRNLTDPLQPDYGYEPALQAMIDRLAHVMP